MNKKVYAIDKMLYRLINHSLYNIVFWIAVIFSIMVRVHLAPQCISGDYKGFITNWITAYAKEPFWQSFGHAITNYYEPYNFLLDLFAHLPFPAWVWISFSSCLAEYVTAFYLYKLVFLVGSGQGIKYTQHIAQFVVIAVLFLPMAMMNGALWKQCDAIYTCFAIMGLYYFIKDQYTISFVFLAISFLFKLQAVFIVPFFLIMYICRQNFSVMKFVWLPSLYVIAGIPAILLNRGFHATYLTYFKQTQDVPMMSASSPSIYRFGLKNFEAFGNTAIFITIIVLMLATVYLYAHKKCIDKNMMFYFAGWIVMTCFVFLPEMHERYDYMALILLTAYIAAYKKKLLWCVVIMNLCTAMTYSYYLFDFNDISLSVIALFYNVAYAVITMDVIHTIKGNKTDYDKKMEQNCGDE